MSVQQGVLCVSRLNLVHIIIKLLLESLLIDIRRIVQKILSLKVKIDSSLKTTGATDDYVWVGEFEAFCDFFFVFVEDVFVSQS